MMRFRHSRLLLLYAALLAGCALGSGCATNSQAQNQQWTPQEDRAYRHYLTEQHLPYQDFSMLGGEQQNAYWVWRHDHPDAGGN